jgi:hypothetical protein
MTGKRIKLSVEIIVNKILKVGPFPTLVAKSLGVSYQAIYARSTKSKQIRDAFVTAGEQFLDDAENAVYKAIKKGNAKIAIQVLKTRGKNRGYSTRIETTGIEGGPIREAIGPDLENLSDDALREYLTGLAKAATDLASKSPATSPGGDDPPG